FLARRARFPGPVPRPAAGLAAGLLAGTVDAGHGTLPRAARWAGGPGGRRAAEPIVLAVGSAVRVVGSGGRPRLAWAPWGHPLWVPAGHGGVAGRPGRAVVGPRTLPPPSCLPTGVPAPEDRF